jgi:hypothetical protein
LPTTLKDGEIREGEIGEEGCEETFLCFIQTKEKCRSTCSATWSCSIELYKQWYTLADFLPNWNFRGVFCKSLILLFIYVPTFAQCVFNMHVCNNKQFKYKKRRIRRHMKRRIRRDE